MSQVIKERISIGRIIITNCTVYQGEHLIEFSTDPEKNFNIILADSGSGKSSIFELVFWVLYGQHYRLQDPTDENIEGIINSERLSKLKINESLEAKVELFLFDNGREKYRIERRLKATKNDESTGTIFSTINNSTISKGIQIQTTSQLTITTSTEPDIITKEDQINNKIKSVLPENLSQFLLFDGEKLDLVKGKEKSTQFIKDGIEKISGLPIIDRSVENIQMTLKALESSGKGNDKIIRSLFATREQAESNLTNLNEKLEKLKKEKQQTEQDLKSRQSLLESEKDGKNIQDQIDSNKDVLKILKGNRTKLKEEKYQLLYNSLPKLWMRQTLKNCQEYFKILRKEGKFPSPFTQEAIKQIIESTPKECICGRPFESGSPEEIELEVKLKKSTAKDISLLLLDGDRTISEQLEYGNIKIIDDQNLKLAEDFSTNQDSINGIDITIQELNDKHSKVTSSKYDYDTLKKEEHEFLVKLMTIQNGLDGIDQTKKEITTADYTFKESDKEWRLEREKQKGFQQIKNQEIIAKAAKKYLEDKREYLADKFRSIVQANTERNFLKYGPQSGDYDGVKINKNYDIRPTKDMGMGIPTVAGTSAGQSHSLVLSYVCGCRDIYPKNLFLMIDSPLHNISEDDRISAIKMLLKSLTNVQIILLVTGTEYTSSGVRTSIRDLLDKEGKIGKELNIKRTCLDCDKKILERISEPEDDPIFKCPNCEKIYKKDDKQGPRKIEEFVK